MVPASPAQFQFSHSRGSPALQGFHLRASAHQSLWQPAGNLRSRRPTTNEPSARPRSGARQAQSREANAGWRRGSGGQRRRGSHTHRLRGDSPEAEAGRAYRCSCQFRSAPAGPGSQAGAGALDRPCPPLRAPPVGLPHPFPAKRLAGTIRGPGRMTALPESGPHTGCVSALDLLQDPLVFRDGPQTFAALRHLGWKLRSRRSAAPRGPRERAAPGAPMGGAGTERSARHPAPIQALTPAQGPGSPWKGKERKRASRSAPPLVPAAALRIAWLSHIFLFSVYQTLCYKNKIITLNL